MLTGTQVQLVRAAVAGQPIVTTTRAHVFYVGSTVTGAADNANSRTGRDPETPFATLDYAVGRCTASHCDVIYLLPGHTEAVTATNIALDVAGITIIGIGNGRNRPSFTFGATTSTITVSAANIKISNCFFDLTGIDAVVSGFTCDAANDLTFANCEFATNSGTTGCVTAITMGTTTACDRWVVDNCLFVGPATNSGTTTTAQITYTKGVDFVVKDSYFIGKCTQNITNGAAVLRGLITRNNFVTYTGTKAINVHASSTPFITNNRINVPSGTAPIVAAAGFVAGNVYSAAAGVTAGTASTI